MLDPPLREWKIIAGDFLPIVENIEFSCGADEETDEFIENINKFLHRHTSPLIRSLKIFFAWGDESLEEHKIQLKECIEFALNKSVYDLDVYCPSYDDWDDLFVVPKRLFACPSITSLKLRTCQFNPQQTFGGLKSLRFLYLKEACTSNKAFKATLENCLLLEELTLQDSFCEYEMRILASEDSQLKSLLVIDSHLCDSDSHEPNAARKIEVAVPNLKKVDFYGRLFDNYKFQNHLSLEEVCIDSTMHKRDE
ncbi:hypothetical protein Scep_028524 [Stephania cephalantha]|uniref:At1g61320/AtMIF1 LRR domain-containing protein n=1 Tax=Stephania cephalantha TaxID=152367 RepID=A0AAP0HLW5_9MAGN